MKQIFLSLLIIYAAFVNLACPQKTAIRKASEASFQLAGSINDAQKAVESAFDGQIIGKATAIKLNDSLRRANDGSVKLTNAVDALRKLYADGAPLPQTKLDVLNLILSDEVITPLLQILDELKIVSASRAPALFAAIASVKTLVIVISSAFPAKSSVSLQLERRNDVAVNFAPLG